MALGLQAHFGGGLTLKQGQGQAAQEGEVLGAIAFTEPTVVFMKGYTLREAPMQFVLDAPMTADHG